MPQNIFRKAKSRAVVLRYFPFIAILLLDVVFLFMLDNLFANKKRALIVDSQDKFLILNKDINPIGQGINALVDPYRDREEKDLTEEMKKTLAKQYEDYLKKVKTSLEKEVPKVIQGNHPWYRVVFKDREDRVVYEYEDRNKLQEWNDWTNCLFSRSFHAPVGTPSMHLTVYYASPKGWPEIEQMVFRYWMYAIAFVLSTWVLHIWLTLYVFRPLQRIGSAIETTIDTAQVTMIHHPSRDIEEAYNQLARNQREISFGLEVDRIVDELHSLADDREVLEQFLRVLAVAVPRVYPVQKAESTFLLAVESSVSPQVNISPDNREFTLTLNLGDQPVGALHCRLEPSCTREEIEWMIGEIQKQAQNGLARSVSRSRVLTQERNRFGINLATNMGHDLTNIIASGKWDLDTIQRAQSFGIIRLDEKNGNFYTQAVEGLENNLQFLQEMVDIYRSVAYIQRPRFEPADLAHLVRQVSELFHRSTSQNLSISVTGEESVPMNLEPRLLRMALFNLLANAYQAIQRNANRSQQNRIEIQIKRSNAQTVEVIVNDNGPGIRDFEGQLLQDSEISRIFQSGYSTKQENSGGGLGLTWVKSIVEEFHHGTLHAANRPEGGAAIHMTLSLHTPQQGEDSLLYSH